MALAYVFDATIASAKSSKLNRSTLQSCNEKTPEAYRLLELVFCFVCLFCVVRTCETFAAVMEQAQSLLLPFADIRPRASF